MYNDLYFNVFQSDKDGKYYWRLLKKSTSSFPLPLPQIIATGHQAYSTRELAKRDIESVKSAMPGTPII